MEKWFIKNKKADFDTIASTFGISNIVARLSVNRDIHSNEEMEAYLHPDKKRLHDPKLMKDMVKSVSILKEKIEAGKRIRIVGDYDVDGVMATYILYTGLMECNANVDYEIPERIKDGYGINISIIDAAYEDGIDTIITCDNGIAALNQVKHAKELGMTVIVTDHHDIPFTEEDEVRTFHVPEADAVVNPKQQDCPYPFKGLCGGVVAYKLVSCLYETMGINSNKIDDLLEFAAIATVCDVMDLVEENRIIVKYGLEKMSHTNQVGLKALMEETGIADKKTSVYHLGFVIGPCINASGRLESAKVSLRLLLCKDKAFAKEMARELKELNDERKEMTSVGLEQAIEYIETKDMTEDKVLIVYIPNCHESLAGIIAGRIRERYHKPAIVLCKAHEGVKGSARSIDEYNMFEELNQCKELLTKFGGHPMAAGLSLEERNIESLRERLNDITTLTEDDLIEKVSFDMVLPLKDITFPLLKEMSFLEPYGKGNPKPLFALKNVHIIKANILGKNKNVLKLMVEETDSRIKFPAMLFNQVEAFEEMVLNKYGKDGLDAVYGGFQSQVFFDIVFYPDINEYNGMQTIQIMVQYFR